MHRYLVVVAAAVVLTACEFRRECVRTGLRSIPTTECIDGGAAGPGCKVWVTREKMQAACLEYRCKEGYQYGDNRIRERTLPAIPKQCLTQEEFSKQL